MHRGFGRLYRVILVVNGGGGTGKVIDFVDLDIQREGDVVAKELKERVIMVALNILLAARIKIIDADDFLTVGQQTIDQM
jgi:hypothetical protein